MIEEISEENKTLRNKLEQYTKENQELHQSQESLSSRSVVAEDALGETMSALEALTTKVAS